MLKHEARLQKSLLVRNHQLNKQSKASVSVLNSDVMAYLQEWKANKEILQLEKVQMLIKTRSPPIKGGGVYAPKKPITLPPLRKTTGLGDTPRNNQSKSRSKSLDCGASSGKHDEKEQEMSQSHTNPTVTTGRSREGSFVIDDNLIAQSHTAPQIPAFDISKLGTKLPHQLFNLNLKRPNSPRGTTVVSSSSPNANASSVGANNETTTTVPTSTGQFAMKRGRTLTKLTTNLPVLTEEEDDDKPLFMLSNIHIPRRISEVVDSQTNTLVLTKAFLDRTGRLSLPKISRAMKDESYHFEAKHAASIEKSDPFHTSTKKRKVKSPHRRGPPDITNTDWTVLLSDIPGGGGFAPKVMQTSQTAVEMHKKGARKKRSNRAKYDIEQDDSVPGGERAEGQTLTKEDSFNDTNMFENLPYQVEVVIPKRNTKHCVVLKEKPRYKPRLSNESKQILQHCNLHNKRLLDLYEDMDKHKDKYERRWERKQEWKQQRMEAEFSKIEGGGGAGSRQDTSKHGGDQRLGLLLAEEMVSRQGSTLSKSSRT